MHLPPDLCKSCLVVDHSSEFRSLRVEGLEHLRVAEHLQSYSLCVGLASGIPTLASLLLGTCAGGLCVGLGSRACCTAGHVADVQGEHLAVPDLELLHGLGGIAEELAVVVEVLGGGWDVGFDLDCFLEEADGGVWGYFEGEEVVIVRWGSYADCDTPWRESVFETYAINRSSTNILRVGAATRVWLVLEMGGDEEAVGVLYNLCRPPKAKKSLVNSYPR